MASSAPTKNDFSIKRANLTKIKELKEKLQKLEGETFTEQQPKQASAPKNPNRPKQNPYEKRKPLNDQERKVVSDL